jgi:hypothetical protein
MANEDREVIEQIRAAIADMDRLRADSLEILNHSNQLLRMIDLMNRPLMGGPPAMNSNGADYC